MYIFFPKKRRREKETRFGVSYTEWLDRSDSVLGTEARFFLSFFFSLSGPVLLLVCFGITWNKLFGTILLLYGDTGLNRGGGGLALPGSRAVRCESMLVARGKKNYPVSLFGAYFVPVSGGEKTKKRYQREWGFREMMMSKSRVAPHRGKRCGHG